MNDNLSSAQFGHGYDSPTALSTRLDDMYQEGGEGEINHDLVNQYAADMKRGDQFPPITVLGHGPDDPHRWVVDGNHRTLAAVKAGLAKIPAVHTLDIDG